MKMKCKADDIYFFIALIKSRLSYWSRSYGYLYFTSPGIVPYMQWEKVLPTVSFIIAFHTNVLSGYITIPHVSGQNGGL